MEVSVLSEDGIPYVAFINTNLEEESKQRLEQVFKGHVNMVFDPLRQAA